MAALECPDRRSALLPTGYGVRCTAHWGNGLSFGLGGHTAATAEGAVEWMHRRVREAAEQLDTPAPALAERWLADRSEQDHALDVLKAGAGYDLDLVSDGVRYAFRARVEYWPEVTVAANGP
ncbi:hypothetical protein OG742_12250 [Streptomyces sp. NBC_00828]|uniref:hypothetical protein n=1 Tax=Streptomyces sp. NBC_00828 TaxID=2903678 RepID=UPI0038695DAB